MSRRPLRSILFCTSGYFPDLIGGAEHQARLQAEELSRRGYRVVVACPRRNGVRSGTVGSVEVHRLAVIARPYLHEITFSLHLFLFLMWQMRRFQLVHVHMTHLQTGVICVAARLWRRPVYVKIARGGPTGDARYLSKRWYLRRLALSYPSRFQAISGEIAEDLASIGVPTDRVVRIPNGIALDSVQHPDGAQKRELRTRLGLPLGAVIVLFLGRFVRMKGQATLLEAWSAIDEPSAVLALVGRRPSDRVAPEASANVIVHDWTTQPGDYHAAADIFVQPSRSEGMSNALLAAMAHGLPCIATTVGAAESMIEDGVSGYLIAPDDADTLRKRLQTLIRDPQLRASMGAAAAQRVADNYSIQSVVDRIEAEYEGMKTLSTQHSASLADVAETVESPPCPSATNDWRRLSRP